MIDSAVLRPFDSPGLLLLAALPGGGCSPSLEPIVVGPDCPQKPFRGPELYADEPADRLLSDFESGTTELANVANRDGSWIHGRDLTSVSVTIGPSMECAARGQWAGQLAASTPTSWGNNWTAYFRAPGTSAPVPYDGSQYGGVSFWAAFGADNGPPLRRAVRHRHDGYRETVVHHALRRPLHGVCDADPRMAAVRAPLRRPGSANAPADARCAAISSSDSSSGRSSSATSGSTTSDWNP